MANRQQRRARDRAVPRPRTGGSRPRVDALREEGHGRWAAAGEAREARVSSPVDDVDEGASAVVGALRALVAIRRRAARLAADERAALAVARASGLTYHDIATALGITDDAARKRVERKVARA